MPRLHPDRIPDAIRRDPSRQAECAVYDALLETLPEEYSVFGWVAWVGRKPGNGARDGEADFVIAHPEHGILVLEVKGGAIEHDATTSRWSSTSVSGKTHPLPQSPFLQASGHRFDLERKLSECSGWHGRPVTFGWAVAFPDCAMPDGDLGLNAPRELLICREDLGRIDERIRAIGQYWHRQAHTDSPLGADGVRLVEQLLAQSFKLRMPLGRQIDEDSRDIIELTEAQYGVLDGLARNRRVLVTGGAGTGKTLLALEKAKRLARTEGFRTLMTCFNQPLAEYLAASAGKVPNLTVRNFHDLCIDLARQAGIEVQIPSDEAARNEMYRTGLPNLLADALAVLPERFEAIVLDEGQDFSDTDRTALQMLLDDRAESVLYVFQDETQAIYRDASAWPSDGLAVYELTENRRNTRAIHEVLTHLVGETRTRPLGPQGRPPEFILVRDGREQARELSRVLHRLIREESVPQGAIAVLVASRRGDPPLVENGRIGAFEVTTEHDAADDRVLFESVTRFKGLERDVVILTRLDRVDYVEYGPMLYVGASRARGHLVVMGDEATLARFRGEAMSGATLG